MIKVGSIIEIVQHGPDFISPEDAKSFLVGSRHEVLAFHQETGEVEVCTEVHKLNPDKWTTFFPGEYKLVE